jgi:hypothetical protein
VTDDPNCDVGCPPPEEYRQCGSTALFGFLPAHLAKLFFHRFEFRVPQALGTHSRVPDTNSFGLGDGQGVYVKGKDVIQFNFKTRLLIVLACDFALEGTHLKSGSESALGLLFWLRGPPPHFPLLSKAMLGPSCGARLLCPLEPHHSVHAFDFVLQKVGLG